MKPQWDAKSLREAGISLIDCDHRTPPPVANGSGYPYIAIPQLKEGRIDLSDVRRISAEDFRDWTRKAKPQEDDVILSRRCNPGETAHVPAGLDCALGQNLVLLRSDGTKVFPPFLRWLVRSPQWWEQVNTFINVGAVFDLPELVRQFRSRPRQTRWPPAHRPRPCNRGSLPYALRTYRKRIGAARLASHCHRRNLRD